MFHLLARNVEVPVIETERLVLRGQRLEDFAASAAMWLDPIVVRHTSGTPLTEEDSWSRWLRYAGHWALMGFGYWVVEEKDTGVFVGEVGFANYKRHLEMPHKDAPEIGWILSPQSHGKGYATEAALAAIAWGDAHFGSSPTTCLILPENAPSLRVAEKCGYREVQRSLYKGREILVLVRQAA